MIENIQNLLLSWGDWGMFISALLAGSVFPFNSEVVMAALYMSGVPALPLLVMGTAGNVLGSVINYSIGTLGKEEWISKYTKTSPEKLEKGKRYVQRYGGWAGLLSWVPLLGSLVTVALGYMRVNPYLSFATISVGKFVRYAVVLYLCGATLWR